VGPDVTHAPERDSIIRSPSAIGTECRYRSLPLRCRIGVAVNASLGLHKNVAPTTHRSPRLYKYDESMAEVSRSHEIIRLSTYLCHRDSLGVPRYQKGEECTMPHRINALALAVLASSLAVAIELGTSGSASAARECLRRSGSESDQDGHWYYHVDRVHHRRCWYFESTKVTAGPTALPSEPSSPNGGPEQSWLSRLVAGVKQKLSIGSQEPAPPDDAITERSIPVPKPPKKSARAFKHRFHVASRQERRDATPFAPQLSPAVRDALFQEFLRRYGAERVPSNPPP
jgi:hypothetical protein